MDPILALIALAVVGSVGWKVLKLFLSGAWWMVTRVVGLIFLVIIYALIVGRC